MQNQNTIDSIYSLQETIQEMDIDMACQNVTEILTRAGDATCKKIHIGKDTRTSRGKDTTREDLRDTLKSAKLL
jgi:hypothetical protein